jgi:hypothetical protein
LCFSATARAGLIGFTEIAIRTLGTGLVAFQSRRDHVRYADRTSATALVAAIGNGTAFRKGREFASTAGDRAPPVRPGACNVTNLLAIPFEKVIAV